MKSFVVFGLGRFGQSVARALHEQGNEVLVIDENEEVIQAMTDHVTHAMVGDVTDENVLKAASVANLDAAVVATGKNMESSILLTQLLKEMNMKFILAKAQNDLHAKVLSNLGADRVVFPERDMGIRVARSLVSTNFLDYIELSPDYSIIEITAPEQWAGQTLKKLNARAKYGVTVIAIKKGSKINVAPNADNIINSNDVLVVIGSNDDINRLNKKHSLI